MTKRRQYPTGKGKLKINVVIIYFRIRGDDIRTVVYSNEYRKAKYE